MLSTPAPPLLSEDCENFILELSWVLPGKWTCFVVSCSVGLGFSALKSTFRSEKFQDFAVSVSSPILFVLAVLQGAGVFLLYFWAISGGSRETSLGEWSFSFQLKKTTAITVYLPKMATLTHPKIKVQISKHLNTKLFHRKCLLGTVFKRKNITRHNYSEQSLNCFNCKWLRKIKQIWERLLMECFLWWGECFGNKKWRNTNTRKG